MRVEFIKASEDGTWDTETIEVPEGAVKSQLITGSPKWTAAVQQWAQIKLAGQTQYRKVVYWGIYNSEPEEQDV